MRIYVGGAMDNAPESKKEISDLIETIIEITGGKVIIFNPTTAYRIGNSAISDPNLVGYIKDTNDMCMLKCDLAIFLLNDRMSFGIPIDIDFCAKNEKRFLVIDKGTISSSYLKVIINRSLGKIIKDYIELAQYFKEM